MSALRASRRTASVIVTALLVVDLLAIAAFAVRRTTTTVRTTRPPATSTPNQVNAAPPSAPSTAPPTATAVVPPPVSIAAGGASTTPPTAPHSAPPASPAPPKSTAPGVPVAALGKCPVRIAKPAQLGGVQSLVSFAPAFGPFSAEAFAAAAAYQPELELLGPLLAQYPKVAPVLDPLLAPVLSLFATGSNSLFAAVAPLYSPHRTQVLAAETKLAAALAPYSAKLAGTPVAGCVVDLEAALVGDTKK